MALAHVQVELLEPIAGSPSSCTLLDNAKLFPKAFHHVHGLPPAPCRKGSHLSVSFPMLDVIIPAKSPDLGGYNGILLGFLFILNHPTMCLFGPLRKAK